MIDLDSKYIDFIKNTISTVLTDFELYLFGSRARGNAKKYSDIDIAIKSSEFSEVNKNKIIYIFENSTLPYKIDIIDLNTINEQFKNTINDDLVRI